MSYKQSPTFLTATVVGITCSAAFTGFLYSLSFATIPALLLPPPSKGSTAERSDHKPSVSASHLARQWQNLYDTGKIVGPRIVGASAASLVYAMLQIPAELKMQRGFYVASAVLAISIVPFTLAFMAPTNDTLYMRAEEGKVESEAEEKHPGNVAVGDGQDTPSLLRHWAVLNAVRGTLPLVGIGCVGAALIW